MLNDPRYQRGFPGLPPGADPGQGGSSPRRYLGGDIVPGDVDPSPSLSRVPTAALSTFAIILGAALVAAAAAWALGLRRMRTVPALPPAPLEEAAPRRRLLFGDDAERLAAEGKWGDALHALLLQSIRALVAHSHTPLPPSFTSRELLDRVALPGEARRELAGLVQAVEEAWFGGQPVGPETYHENRERFRRIAGEAG